MVVFHVPFAVPFRLLRPASTLLLHALLWGLGAVLLWAQQPDYPGPEPTEFWLTQAVVFGLLVGLFYLNLGWAAPRLLYRRWPAYLAVNAVAGLAIGVYTLRLTAGASTLAKRVVLH